MNSSVEKCYKFHESAIDLLSSIDFCDTTFKVSLFFVIFNPIFWNIVSRLEYYTHFLTKLTNNPKTGCYILAVTIFTLGIVRNYYFEQALYKQVVSQVLENEFTKSLGVILIVLGQILVITSMYQLGIIGTYCGDYFGILMKERVRAFPFNVCENPMYRGSTLSFLGFSLLQGKGAGLLITFFVHMVYEIALKFEEPFTMKIYRNPKID
ncbi:unnamed protein product [Diatraea saccharalis]|uniref:Phosphatidylethanolamine N-methyltransferase n=1 Tax=Diatraea saccharalis TaxID=40085 RepID=A0A9N9QXJ7_9NEOP|nr:unnamed protein product [Diatraea saccharalis]